MFGKNPLRPMVHGDGSILDVHEIFPTIQGEGPCAGQPAIFIRLSGCNLACSFCDTEFEHFQPYTVEEILHHVIGLARKEGAQDRYDLIVITGGEPLRQPIGPCCEALIKAGFRVQVETNGTFDPRCPEDVMLVCSPKYVGHQLAQIKPSVIARLSAWKVILSAHQDPYRHLPSIVESHREIPIYLQPMDEHDSPKNKKNQEYVLALALEGGYRISLQLHKILGIA